MFAFAKNYKGDKKAKGINNTLSKKMMHEEYKSKLSKKKQVRHGIKRMQSKSHQLGKFQFNKISLSCFDDEWYTLDDRVKSISYSYKDVN